MKNIHCSFPLTPYQKEISHKTCLRIEKKDVLLKCVCGAGKTEMCLETIASHLQKGKKIGFAIARREVVLEVAEQITKLFYKSQSDSRMWRPYIHTGRRYCCTDDTSGIPVLSDI